MTDLLLIPGTRVRVAIAESPYDGLTGMVVRVNDPSAPMARLRNIEVVLDGTLRTLCFSADELVTRTEATR